MNVAREEKKAVPTEIKTWEHMYERMQFISSVARNLLRIQPTSCWNTCHVASDLNNDIKASAADVIISKLFPDRHKAILPVGGLSFKWTVC